MKIAIVCSNLFALSEATKKGTEIISYSLINNLIKYGKTQGLEYVAFASGNSALPVDIQSVDFLPSSADKEILANGKHIIFELALLSRAFSQQSDFDLFHINIGDGDIAVPFTPFVKKPILITLHHIYDANYTRKYFSLFAQASNVFFVSVSNAQRRILPGLNFVDTIYHGVDTHQEYQFNATGGNGVIWAGRLIPEKGPNLVVEVAKRLGKNATLFGISRPEHSAWVEREVFQKISSPTNGLINVELDHQRSHLIPYYQKSRLFLFPVHMEEAFGLVLIESMACGTPVVAFARGAIPEIVEDGVNGFLVNPSPEDIRGNWIVKKTGLDGLNEAVERIYALSAKEYQAMRLACRQRVEEQFSVEQMVSRYEDLYLKLIKRSQSSL